MDDLNKPWWASQTIWGGVGSLVASLGAAYYAYSHNDINAAMMSLGAAAAAAHSIVGRFQATQVIGTPAALPPQPQLAAPTPAAGS